MARTKAITKKVYYRYPRLKWAKQFNSLTNEGYTVDGNSEFSYNIQLCENPANGSNMVPTPRYFKRVKLSFEIETKKSENSADDYNIEGLTGFIVYVPEGISPGPNIIRQHPEWVLGSRFYGGLSIEDQNASYKIFTLYTKLCKKLLSGDKIYIIFTGRNTGSSQVNVYFNLFIEFYTR